MNLPNLRKLGGCKPLSASARFEQSYIPEPMSGCWLWLGSLHGSNGYGRIKIDKKSMPAHRYSWNRANGPIPAGLFVLHRCDNPSCVNPSHLFLGTNADNCADKVKKGRQARGKFLAAAQSNNKPRGARVYNAKLTPKIVEEIRSSNEAAVHIAERLGVSATCIRYARRGLTYAV